MCGRLRPPESANGGGCFLFFEGECRFSFAFPGKGEDAYVRNIGAIDPYIGMHTCPSYLFRQSQVIKRNDRLPFQSCGHFLT